MSIQLAMQQLFLKINLYDTSPVKSQNGKFRKATRRKIVLRANLNLNENQWHVAPLVDNGFTHEMWHEEILKSALFGNKKLKNWK